MIIASYGFTLFTPLQMRYLMVTINKENTLVLSDGVYIYSLLPELFFYAPSLILICLQALTGCSTSVLRDRVLHEK